MNKNVFYTLVLQPAIGVCTSLTTASQMSAYLLLRTGSQTKVGLAVGCQGVANLCAAFPGGWIGDRYGRSTAIRMAVCFGAIGYASVVASVNSASSLSVEHEWMAIAASLFFVGLYTGSQNPNVEAIFGDSVPSGQRSKIYVRKSSLRIAGNSVGPILSVCIFAYLGNEWKASELRWVITLGAVCFILPCSMALSLKEKNSLGAASEALIPTENGRRGAANTNANAATVVVMSSKGDVQEIGGLRAAGPPSRPAPRPPREEEETYSEAALTTRRRIAATIVVSDLIAKLGSGCTIKFVPLYFLQRCHLSPIAVNCVSAVGPLGAAGFAILAQKVSRRFGRVQVTWITKVIGALALGGIAATNNNYIIVPLYLARVCFMNCSTGLTKSVLNDYVPKAERARWNSFEAVNTFGWSGSAAVGGFIIERYGYSIMFVITALMQIFAATILLSIAPLVHAEVSTTKGDSDLVEPLLRGSESSAEFGLVDARDSDDDATPHPREGDAASDAGYSLLDFGADDTKEQDLEGTEARKGSQRPPPPKSTRHRPPKHPSYSTQRTLEERGLALE